MCHEARLTNVPKKAYPGRSPKTTKLGELEVLTPLRDPGAQRRRGV